MPVTVHKTWADWAAMALAIVIVLFGLPILILGFWLIALGGSWYYAPAGIGLLLTAWFLFRRELAAFWVYLATFVLTVAWALWERGLDGWAQIPRLFAPTIIMILVLLCLPVLRRRATTRQFRGAVAAGTVVTLIMGGGAGSAYLGFRPLSAIAQTAPPAVSVPAATRAAAPAQGAAGLAQGAAGLAQGAAEPAQEAAATPLPGAEGSARTMAEPGRDWPAWGGTEQGQRYSPLSAINVANVGQLKKMWIYRTGDLPDQEAKGKYSWENTPIKVGGSLYMCSPKNIMVSVDAATGKEIWRYDPKVPDDAIPYGATCHAVAYYQTPGAAAGSACAARIIEGTLDARLIAVDAVDGRPCADFGRDGEVDLKQGIGETVPGWYAFDAAPVIVRGVIVVGSQVQDGQSENSPSGVVRGFNAVNGRMVWAWDLGQPGRTGAPPPGQTYTRNTPDMWTTPAADERLGYVYLPLGNSPGDYWGGHRRPFDNEYSTSLVAVDVTTGRDVWHFQTVHYDLWDYDLGSQPSLVDFPSRDGSKVPALILTSKQGEIFVLDRRTGKSLFPVDERPAPGGGAEAGRQAKTQPYSAYHSLARPDLTEADMWGMTPLDQLWCRVQFKQADYRGRYTPPTVDRHFIEYPSYNGGSDWGSLAVDDKSGIIVANYNDMANYTELIRRDEADKLHILPIDQPHPPAQGGESGAQAGSPYGVLINPGWQEWTGLMCKQPPYGGIRAIDLKSGKTLWDEPFGLATENGPFHIPLHLPLAIGTPNNGGPLVTGGGLIFIAAATDDLLHAIDIKTGKVVWSDKLPAGGQATPMTYEAGGQQFVVITAGGHHFMQTPVGDYVIAYALPGPGQ